MRVRNPTFLFSVSFLHQCASMRMNAFITCLVHVFFKSLNLRVHAARAAGALLLPRTG